MITGKDDLTKHSGYTAHGTLPDASYRAMELGFSAWQGRTPGKDGTMKADSGPYPAFLNNRSVLLSNGSTVNALMAHDECMPQSQYNPDKVRTWLACCETDNEGTCATPSPLTDDLYEDTWVATEGLQMLKERPAGKPWYMQVNWPGPHGPFIVTKTMRESTASRPYPQPHDYKARGSLNASQLVESRRLYTAEVENLDHWMGEYLKTIEELGDSNNTIVVSTCVGSLVRRRHDVQIRSVQLLALTSSPISRILLPAFRFVPHRWMYQRLPPSPPPVLLFCLGMQCISSDHGELLGDHGDWAKSKPWEGATHVPLTCMGN
jgi:hypothetical protein